MKKTFENPELKRLGTVAELTKTNQNNPTSDVPLGNPIADNGLS